MSGHYAVTLEVELKEHFGHWSIHIWSAHHHTMIGCAAESAGRELLEALSEHALVDGFALDGSDT